VAASERGEVSKDSNAGAYSASNEYSSKRIRCLIWFVRERSKPINFIYKY
jgi:hypothetical protein